MKITDANLHAYALVGLRLERDRLGKLIEEIESLIQGGDIGIVQAPRPKRKFSLAARRRMAKAQQRRWATKRRGK